MTQSQTAFETDIQLAENMQQNIIAFIKKNILGMKVTAFGYENLVPEDMRSDMIKIKDQTANFIRKLPDLYGIFKDKTMFIELKFNYSMIDPVQYKPKLDAMKKRTGYYDIDETTLGQMELEAYNYYKQLIGKGLRVVMIILCAFNKEMIFADYLENLVTLGDYSPDKIIHKPNASLKDYVNIHLGYMRTLKQFFQDEFSFTIDPKEIELLYKKITEW